MMTNTLFSGKVLPQDAASPLLSSRAQPKPRVVHSVKVLNGPKWLTSVVAEHECVRAEMPEFCRCFLLPRSASYYQDLLSGKTGMLFGAFADEKLVGSMALVWAESFAGACTKGLLTCPDPLGRLNKKYGKGRLGVIQALGLRKACLGRKLSCALLRAAIEAAEHKDCLHLLAQVASDNVLGWLRFMERDFAITATWVNGHRRFLLSWLTPRQKAHMVRSAKPEDRQAYDKEYASLPALLTKAVAHATQGKTILLDNQSDEPGQLNFVFV